MRDLIIQQTIGGLCSAPLTEDVLREMAGDHTWQAVYADRGHGEYIENVCATVEYCRRELVSVADALRGAQWELR